MKLLFKRWNFMGAADEFFEGLERTFKWIIGLFVMFLIAAVIISPIFGYLAGWIFFVIMLFIFVFHDFFEHFYRWIKKRKGENTIGYNNENKTNIDKSDTHNSFTISQDNYSNQVEGYTVQKTGKKKRWK